VEVDLYNTGSNNTIIYALDGTPQNANPKFFIIALHLSFFLEMERGYRKIPEELDTRFLLNH